jgi:hypothetical protein
LALLDKTFKQPPKAFDLARQWQQTSTRRFEAEIDSTTATPRVSTPHKQMPAVRCGRRWLYASRSGARVASA